MVPITVVPRQEDFANEITKLILVKHGHCNPKKGSIVFFKTHHYKTKTKGRRTNIEKPKAYESAK